MKNNLLEEIEKKLANVPIGKLKNVNYVSKDVKTISDFHCHSLDFKGKGIIETYGVFPGIEISFFYILSDKFSFCHEEKPSSMEINYCRFGRIGWKLIDNSAVYLGSGDLSINTMDVCAKCHMALPLGYYEGVTVCIDLETLTENPPDDLLSVGIDGEKLKQKFCANGKFTSIAESSETENIFEGFYNNPKDLELSYFKIKVCELILYLCKTNHSQKSKSAKYPSNQIEIIKQIHEEMLYKLDQRFTIEELSKRYLMNPTTLKTLFKAVYGDSIASHIKEHRMEKALQLLCETSLSIAEVAQNVGYESQSKFTKAFRETYDILPTEYRKIHSKNSAF